ncbi:MAG: UDP-N-acetylmuramate dehydrogenase [Bacteroidales bacterium]|nr:UDP-N-acetylmuramate dehydrogenase [Bacteroidales bacterium]
MKVYRNHSLKDHNTFGMDVRCAQFVVMEHPDEREAMSAAHLFEAPFYILGGGSNILFTRPYEGTIIHPDFKGIEVMEDSERHQLIRVATGEEWDNVIDYCVRHNLYGLENLVGIPGRAGSAPVQNIGAYGVEVKDCIDRVEGFLTDTLQPFALSAEQCQFGYRDSIFKHELKGKSLITHVWFRLSKEEHYTLTYKALANEITVQDLSLETVTQCILRIRNSKLPDIRKIGCAGSFFKNPVVPENQYHDLLTRFPDLVSYPAADGMVKLAAGQLIEKAGWKGKRIGDAGVYPLQALVIVNYGGASPEEICQVFQQVILDVEELFNIRLTPEVNIL